MKHHKIFIGLSYILDVNLLANTVVLRIKGNMTATVTISVTLLIDDVTFILITNTSEQYMEVTYKYTVIFV